MKLDDDPFSETIEQEFDAISFKTFELHPRVLNPYRIISTLILWRKSVNRVLRKATKSSQVQWSLLNTYKSTKIGLFYSGTDLLSPLTFYDWMRTRMAQSR